MNIYRNFANPMGQKMVEITHPSHYDHFLNNILPSLRKCDNFAN